jgi:hypothetical protein
MHYGLLCDFRNESEKVGEIRSLVLPRHGGWARAGARLARLAGWQNRHGQA